jgi:2-dehydro-3-deoxyphosphogluconate aldolase / (4S)-4-hydroxy-2-oxoglutarate aldolase
MTWDASARLLAIVRYHDGGDIAGTLEALEQGGARLLEVTIDTPGALDAVERAAQDGRPVGVGTVRTRDHVRACADAGAAFVVSPGSFPDVAETARELGVDAVLGALTPTEVGTAEKAGAVAVKIFPASLGGAGYVRALRGPFPQTPLVPTGGIRIEDVGSYLSAGATCVGLGSDLVGRSAPSNDADLERIAKLAARAIAAAGVAG